MNFDWEATSPLIKLCDGKKMVSSISFTVKNILSADCTAAAIYLALLADRSIRIGKQSLLWAGVSLKPPGSQNMNQGSK
ncbi:MAG TPA: hypothetical protein VGR96_12065 [Acidobacteriaceae bacterium]|nr:hypothetical protein [Acidobacteriaceae bacterium]